MRRRRRSGQARGDEAAASPRRPKRSDTRANTRRIVTVSAATKASVAAVARKGGGEECGEGGEGGGWDEQFAVGLSSGAEIMVRGVVEALRAGRAVAITDRSHAYQSADRGKLLEGLQSMGANSTSAAFAARYSDGVPITGLDITATQGVVQGDPLAPLSFGSLQAAQTRRLQADPSLAPLFDNGARILSYLDDIVLVAPDADGLERLVEALEKDDAGIGLKLNNAKCAASPSEIGATSPARGVRWSSVSLSDLTTSSGGTRPPPSRRRRRWRRRSSRRACPTTTAS